jgi:hypothetical protein
MNGGIRDTERLWYLSKSASRDHATVEWVNISFTAFGKKRSG